MNLNAVKIAVVKNEITAFLASCFQFKILIGTDNGYSVDASALILSKAVWVCFRVSYFQADHILLRFTQSKPYKIRMKSLVRPVEKYVNEWEFNVLCFIRYATGPECNSASLTANPDHYMLDFNRSFDCDYHVE